MEAADLYPKINPPSIVRYREIGGNGLVAHVLGEEGCDSSRGLASVVVREILRPLQVIRFLDLTRGKYYEFMMELNNPRPFAVQVYRINYNGDPKQIEKIVYLRKRRVILYKEGIGNFSSDGIIDWSNPKKVRCVSNDYAEHEKEVEEAYEDYLKEQRLENIKQHRREQERGGVTMFGLIHMPIRRTPISMKRSNHRKTIPRASKK